MHRFYIPPVAWNPDDLRLDEAESHHALHVLRLKAGDKVVVFNGRGVEATAEIADDNASAKSGVRLRVRQMAKTPPLPCRITLAQAVPKGKNMDFIVQKSVELGAGAVLPLLSERVVSRLDPAEAAARREKWQAVAIEAAKQCGQNWLPEIGLPQTPKAFFQTLGRGAFELMLIASLQTDARHLREYLADFAAARPNQPRPASALVLVGPEGDFTPAELSLARSAGCRPITLGPIVLRVETAALYCLSVLSYELLSNAR
ncbi:MAG: 16S rRNA (uracil(1498)-N(3))-methyltransferase [Verrucomicrobia bacterium]|nr:16S rRNA (uracil(1498)-N(3))-methyltransferase [Verrucomicrobiota bacterium]MBV9657884.1 16S rRNA (uracil(1498)-N(3))-methyltransferase [Verrucomicrobiota bacterium]